MARKEVYTKELLLEQTANYVKKYGVNNLNARDLCKYIGCSTQPLFKCFKNMDELKKELKKELHDYYDIFISNIVDKNNYLFTISYAYALFALYEANIFQILFMSEIAGKRTVKEVLESSWNIETIASIPTQYGISKKAAEELYRDVRFYTHGLSSQLACRSIILTEAEIKQLITGLINKLTR